MNDKLILEIRTNEEGLYVNGTISFKELVAVTMYLVKQMNEISDIPYNDILDDLKEHETLLDLPIDTQVV